MHSLPSAFAEKELLLAAVVASETATRSADEQVEVCLEAEKQLR